MPTLEAVERRRIARALKGAKPNRKGELDPARIERLVRMMNVRYFGKTPEVMEFSITAEYRYWQARSCGWDATCREICRGPDGRRSDPRSTEFWQWWRSLHSNQRKQLANLSITGTDRAGQLSGSPPVTRKW